VVALVAIIHAIVENSNPNYENNNYPMEELR
jgi:hypothetical protein